MKVVHIITGLSSGGAETMLLKLLSAGRSASDSAVVSLSREGPIGKKISDLGIPVYNLNLTRGLPDPVKLFSMIPLVRRLRPQLIQGWMPHGNFMAMIAGISLWNRVPVLWNIRMSLYDPDLERKVTAMLIRLGARLSWYPEKIIYNSTVAAEQHEAHGYRAAKRIVIPNGFDCQMFQPSDKARCSVREELGIKADDVLVGLIARYHPMKDHPGFLQAAGVLARNHPNVYFLLAGTGVTASQNALAQVVEEEKLQGRVFLLGERSDIPRLTAALDIACSASAWAEGFSNALGEAMACAVPCVTTDVGDSAHIVADTGLAVPANHPLELAQAISSLIKMGRERRRQLGLAARRRVETEFALPSIASRYYELYQSLLRPDMNAERVAV